MERFIELRTFWKGDEFFFIEFAEDENGDTHGHFCKTLFNESELKNGKYVSCGNTILKSVNLGQWSREKAHTFAKQCGF